MSYSVVDSKFCKGCLRCVSICPKKCLGLSGNTNANGYDYVEFKSEREKDCTGCAMCRLVCPDVAITVYKT